MSASYDSPARRASSEDVVPELPTSTDIAGVYSTSGSSNMQHNQITPASPTSHHRGRARGGSSASRVALDYFDPEGIHDLRRTITQQSAAARSTRSGRSISAARRAPSVSEGASSSTSTIAAELDAEKFDLERFLKGLVQRCAFSFNHSLLRGISY